MTKPTHHATVTHARSVILGVYAPYNRAIDMDSYFEEFENLLRTNDVPYLDALFIKLREIDSTYFLTKGKLEELKEMCDKAEAEYLFVSEPLTTQQERNLGDYLNCKIIDRTLLILEIFEKSAHTAEGKLQVEIARLQHEKARLAGKGIHLAQQKGGIGIKGGIGETLKERQKRIIDESVQRLKKQLDVYKKNREVQRKKRLINRIPHACLIGYTNAGKSTILNMLTKSNVLAEDKLFATLDTTTRELYINGLKKGIISDTVGFIQQLPHRLIDAFKSTLSELQYADLLVHVIDISDRNWQEHIAVVHAILKELDIQKEMLYVFNKADKLDPMMEIPSQIFRYQPHVICSASSLEGISPLTEYLEEWKPQPVEQTETCID